MSKSCVKSSILASVSHLCHQEIKGYVQSYCDRNFLLKILGTGRDREIHEYFVSRLGTQLAVSFQLTLSIYLYNFQSELLQISRMAQHNCFSIIKGGFSRNLSCSSYA